MEEEQRRERQYLEVEGKSVLTQPTQSPTCLSSQPEIPVKESCGHGKIWNQFICFYIPAE